MNTIPDRAIIIPDSPTLSTSSAYTTTESSLDTLSITTTRSMSLTSKMPATSSATNFLAFHGDGCEGEDSKSWFKSFRRATVEWDDAKRLVNFDLFLEHDAEEWWESPVGVTCSGTWATTTNGFLAKFPFIPDLVEGCTVLFE